MEAALQKNNAKVATVANQAARKCGEETCSTVSQFENGAKDWEKCMNCDILYCPKHLKQYREHVKICIWKTNSDSESVTAAV